jgi:integrase
MIQPEPSNAAMENEMTSDDHIQQVVSPIFRVFAKEWLDANAVRLKRSTHKLHQNIMHKILIPAFGETDIRQISKEQLLSFRQSLVAPEQVGKGMSSGRINSIMQPLRLLLDEASSRFGFESPTAALTMLSVPEPTIDPFSLSDIRRFLKNIRTDYRNYYLVRFFTGMRDSEINGLKWRYVDFDRRVIEIRETLLAGNMDLERRPELRRDIHMANSVYNALEAQREVTPSCNDFVFCTKSAKPVCSASVTTNIWYPTLTKAGIRKRCPHQTRHTAAILLLAAGERPEWVARQMGHRNVRALMEIYWRYVPSLDARNGVAFDRMLSRHLHL